MPGGANIIQKKVCTDSISTLPRPSGDAAGSTAISEMTPEVVKKKTDMVSD